MSEQGDKFVAEYLGGREPLSFEASLAYLRQSAGSNRGASKLAGLSKSAVQDWVSGRRHPSAASREKVEATARALRTPRKSDDQLALQVINLDRKRTRGRHPRKPVSAESLDLAPGTMAKARDVYISTGSADKAYAAFLSGIGNDFYKSSLARSAGFRLDEDLAYEGLFEDYGMTLI